MTKAETSAPIRGVTQTVIGSPLREAVRSLVLLSGQVASNSFAARLGRSILELPLNDKSNLLMHWIDQAQQLAAWLDRDCWPVRVIFDQTSSLPVVAHPPQNVVVTVERDPGDYRGTGGLLRDLATQYRDEDYLIVANGAQVVLGRLTEHVSRMIEMGGDVCVVSHADGTPSGLMWIRCAALRAIPAYGFVDMKEQALPMIARHFDVRVLHCDQPTALTVRTRSDYLRALQILHGTATAASPNPFAENLHSAFNVVENGAVVDPNAILRDSVVLAGGIIESGAIVVRSVVGAKGHVRAKAREIENIVA